ncbi:hypothetical protein BASA81_000890 [Batrachochytrium salamandrivorans]|nr:hypothetical protein BASA81_000890 [Batrachochytrium salamandrivorans]
MESNAELERQFYEEDFIEDDEDDDGFATKQAPTISPVSLPAPSTSAPNRSRSRSSSLLQFFSLSSSPSSSLNPDLLPKTRASSTFNTCTSFPSDGEARTSLLKLASFGSSPMRSPSELFRRPSQSSLSSSPPEFGIGDKHHRIKLKFENKRDRQLL